MYWRYATKVPIVRKTREELAAIYGEPDQPPVETTPPEPEQETDSEQETEPAEDSAASVEADSP